MGDSITEKVIGIIAEQAVLEPSDISLHASIEDLGLDSLALVEAVFSIEEEFAITVPFNANEPEQSDFDISSVKSIVEAVKSLVEAK